MRITIDTDELSRASTTGAAPTDIPVVDAGAAPIEHIKRMIGARTGGMGTGGGGAGALLQAGEDLNVRLPAAADAPLNPLRAGAAAFAATIDGGRAAHALERGVPVSDAAPPARKARAQSKPRRKA